MKLMEAVEQILLVGQKMTIILLAAQIMMSEWGRPAEGNDGNKMSGGIGNELLFGGSGHDIMNGEDGNVWWEG
jgi:hypothetical protein